MSYIQKLKQKSEEDLAKLRGEAEKLRNNGSVDNTFWYPDTDKAGNGYARVRFLPAPEVDLPDALPFVRVFSHKFENSRGEKYVNLCLSTLGLRDPVMDLCRILWKAGDQKNKDMYQKYKRKATYITNLQVLDDELHPENNGLVKRFRAGPKIWIKFEQAMEPKVKKDIPFNPFDLMNGADFEIRIKQVGGFRNYDDSKFLNQSALSTNDDELEEIMSKALSLKTFIDPSRFKSFDELKAELDSVLLETEEDRGAAAGKLNKSGMSPAFEKIESKPKAAPKTESKPKETPKSSVTTDDPPFDVDDGIDSDFFNDI